MKRVMDVLMVGALCWGSVVTAQSTVDVANRVNSNLAQTTSVVGGGDSNSDSDAIAIAEGGVGIGLSDSFSNSGVSISTTTNVRGRTFPLGTVPAYLPLWQHGGWGTVKGYFANGPTSEDRVYERTFNPGDAEDMDQLRGVLTAIPHTGVFSMAGGLWNGVTKMFGGPDRFHHGRGFEIANSIIRHRRHHGKPLMVFIDSEIDKKILFKAGYAYIGKISVEGKYSRNWDQVYNAAIAEALPWNVDILLVSGGMKGVTVGSNSAYPNASMGYSQLNYSLSLGGSHAKGVTEGKGKPVLSAEAFRFSPRMGRKQRLPRQFYSRLVARYAKAQEKSLQVPSAYVTPTTGIRGVAISNELMQMAGFKQSEAQRIDYVQATQQAQP